MRFAKYLLCIILLPSVLAAQTPITNATVIKMAKAGLSDDIIIDMIDSRPGTFATNPQDLITLKRDGVSNKVIAAIIAKSVKVPPSSNNQSTVSHRTRPDTAEHSASVGAGDSSITSGVVEAEIGNGDLKPARFADIFVVPAGEGEKVRDLLIEAAQDMEKALPAVQQDGPAGVGLFNDQCLRFLGKTKISLIKGGMKAAENGQPAKTTNADEMGKFQLRKIQIDPFEIIAFGKAGMSAAVWTSKSMAANHNNFIKLTQPVLSCFDESGNF